MRDWFRNREGMMVNENQIGRIVVDAAVAVHRGLGPGLLESVYEVVLAQELQKRGLKVRRQVPVAITYEGITFDEGFRADLVIEDCVLAELKSVEKSRAGMARSTAPPATSLARPAAMGTPGTLAMPIPMA